MSAEFGGTPPGPPLTPFDTHLALAYVVMLDDLDECPFEAFGFGTVYPQRVAADVNCSGSITAYDASLILQYSVGLIDALPCPSPYKFYALSDTCTDDCESSIDWVGVLIGDLSPPVCTAGSTSTDTVFAGLGPGTYYDSTVEVPISLVNSHDVYSFLIDLSYDADDLMLISVTAVGGASTYMHSFKDTGGHVTIGAAGAGQEIYGDTTIVLLTFERYYPEEEYCGRITLESAMFNEGDPPGGTIDYCTRLWDGITSVTDVDNDQGRQVRLRWNRTWHDNPETDTLVTAYTILRRVDQYLLTDTWQGGPSLSGLGYPPGEWEQVKTVSAWGEDTYTTTCETLCDSTADQGICWSVFFIRAETDTPWVYFDCMPDSGYSVDNLAPQPPPGLIMPSPTEIAWEQVSDEDFDYYTVYGSERSVLDGSETVIDYTSRLQLDVAGHVYGYYHVSATDFSGNEGVASSVENNFAGAPRGDLPETFALQQNTPNPFETRTVIGFDLPQAAVVGLTVFDVEGRAIIRLTDQEWGAGRHSVTWRGVDSAGNLVCPGIYFIRMEAEGFTAFKKMMVLR
jgi:hypothetical protein